MTKLKLKKNDRVVVTAGKDKGKIGKVLKITLDKTRVVVEKVNMIKRHTRPSTKGKGGIVEKEAPIHISNVSIICGKCTEVSRVGKRILQDGSRVRVCRKCGEFLDS
jgi:large subunit ribosomal protein L24